MIKKYYINLNPDENPNGLYLNLGLLYNPFPKTAICVGDLGDPDPKFAKMVREMDVEKHLKGGVKPEQLKWLLKDIVSKEVIDIILKDIDLGDRLEVIIDGDKMQLYKRKVDALEFKKLTHPYRITA